MSLHGKIVFQHLLRTCCLCLPAADGVEERNVLERNLAAYVHPIFPAGSGGGQQAGQEDGQEDEDSEERSTTAPGGFLIVGLDDWMFGFLDFCFLCIYSQTRNQKQKRCW